ncbi:hypothetical protein [Algicella marina]|uniref:Uncharacterized protein n=1 Tax=Algicella marina TaxID=2683284 RepID=A0A6P1SWN9_9RHOB|nr:hypothetical protein [Algicella marina]QHQ34070.1 hypothetical protein GO499_02155 [Algicella marina]
MPMMFRNALIAMVLGMLGLAAPAKAGSFEETCRYFDGVAFNDVAHHRVGTFRVVLAADCRAALAVMAVAPAGAHTEFAQDYLRQLQTYRATMLSIMMERFETQRSRRVLQAHTDAPMVKPVSRAGAFLIAKSMGLVAKQREWTVWNEARLAQ